jgi:hypothetical protein
MYQDYSMFLCSCDPTVRFVCTIDHSRIERILIYTRFNCRSYTGYLDAAYGTQHLFFYFYESRNDPVIMWINGGPRYSSSTGLFMELGPCRVNLDGNATTFTWNNDANIFFLGQPLVLLIQALHSVNLGVFCSKCRGRLFVC